MASISLENPTVQSYLFYSGVLGLKMLGMSALTARTRYSKKAFVNPEDGIVKLNDPDVERVRRAHLNDLENIPVFWTLGALYVTTGPSDVVATTLFRAYTAARVLHTIVYAIKPLPQPARGLSYGVSFFISIYMGVKVVQFYFNAL